MSIPLSRRILLCLTAAAVLHGADADDRVTLVPIPDIRAFPEATEPLAIRRACAKTEADLERFFTARGRNFFSSLVKRFDGYPACHVYYEPTLEGFRAAPDNLPIRKLYVTVDPLGFIVGRKPIGDSWDVVESIVPRLPEAIDLTISVGGVFPEQSWRDAAARHFAGSRRTIQVRASGSKDAHPWSQDHLKAGHVGDELRVLVPRRLYEGRSSDGDTFRPLLDELVKESFVASKLSWEGGDLQVIANPKNPAQTILIHGGSAREYWGEELDPAEYSYVLATEFGADETVDLSSLGPHADYLVALLPGDDIAVVSQSVHNEPRVVESAVAALVELYGKRSPPRLRSLAAFLSTWNRDVSGNSPYLQAQVDAIRRDLPAVAPEVDEQVVSKLMAYADRTCPGPERSCINEEYAATVFEADPKLLRDAADGAAGVLLEQKLAPRLLGLVEGQLAASPRWKPAELDQVAGQLRKLGFRVVRLPHLDAPSVASEWPGVSYVNLLAFDRTLFVPSFGLGKFEERVYSDLRRKLGGKYEVVPVNARSGLSDNGGIHCVFGIVRDLSAPPAVQAP